MRLAANLTWLFTDLPLLERIEAAGNAGFDGVEILFPYEVPAADIRTALEDARLPLALVNTPVPDWKKGGRGFAALPGAEHLFRATFEEALDYARSTGAETVHVMSGVTDAPDTRRTLIENLSWAAAKADDIRLTLEPLNPTDTPGYFLNDFVQATALLAAIGCENVGLQFDAYHAAMIHGDAVEVLRALPSLPFHVQIAHAPGRTAPEPDHPGDAAFLRALREARYLGWVSAEYAPIGPTHAGLGWMEVARNLTGGRTT